MTDEPKDPLISDDAHRFAQRLKSMPWASLIALIYDVTFPSVEHFRAYELEAARRQVEAIGRLDKSSRRLERLSWALVLTSIALLALTAALVWLALGRPWF